jgi:DNA-binding response OmpR family regulator
MTPMILVVDDESVTRRLINHTLKTLPVQVQSFADGRTALEWAQTNKFDLGLVDINLPDIEGFHLIRELHRLPHLADVPIVIFTARSKTEDAANAIQAGAVELFYKPFSTQELRTLTLKYLPA